jgi:hypothetical protein
VNQAGRKFDTRIVRQIFPDWPREVLTGNNVAVQVTFKCACVGFVLRSLKPNDMADIKPDIQYNYKLNIEARS